jgi:hypothetical protein
MATLTDLDSKAVPSRERTESSVAPAIVTGAAGLKDGSGPGTAGHDAALPACQRR